MTAREEAIADCKYAKSLGNTALEKHIQSWSIPFEQHVKQGYLVCPDDDVYIDAIAEISQKLDTDECLLKENI